MTGGLMAPKQKEINWELFEQLCALQCTQSEMASMLKVHIDTLRDRSAEYYKEEYSSVYKRFSEVGKCSLRRYQFVQAKTSTTMAIWLGKQWLRQKDNENFSEVDMQKLKGLADFFSKIPTSPQNDIPSVLSKAG